MLPLRRPLPGQAPLPRRALLLCVAGLLVLAPACGSSGSADTGTGTSAAAGGGAGPTVAPEALGGAYTVSGLRVGGADQPLTSQPKVVIDTSFGGFTLDTACGEMLGAYTLRSDGRAGVTLPGGTVGNCPAAARALHDQVVATLGGVSTWSQNGTTLVLATPSGDQLTLTHR